MRDVLKDLLLWLLTTLLLERAPQIARAILKFTVQRLPRNVQARYAHDFEAELHVIKGNISQLLFALSIVKRIPAIRAGLGGPVVRVGEVMRSLAFLNLITLMAVIVAGMFPDFHAVPQALHYLIVGGLTFATILVSRAALHEAAELLTRYGAIETTGRRGEAYQLRKTPAACPPSSSISQQRLLLSHVGQYRTALSLANALHFPREEVERILEQHFHLGLLTRIYIGHLAVYTPAGITHEPELPAP